MGSKLTVDNLKRLSGEARLIEGKDRLGLNHELGWPLVKFNRLDAATQVKALQNNCIDVHVAIPDCISNIPDSLLTSLILALDCNDNPIVKNIEDLESLA